MCFVTCDILGVQINNVNMNEAVSLANLCLTSEKNSEPKMIFTPNPEFIMNALNDEEFMKILNESWLNIPDGIGIIIGSKILKTPLKERVAGFDFIQNLFANIKNSKIKVYFLGSSEKNVKMAKENMEKKYRGIKIIGYHNGYFSEADNNKIIEEINDLSPDLILVGLGSPRQEKWIYKNKNQLNTKLLIGIGGSFDVMSGNVKRAPKIFINLNLEWFYRFVTQPTRFKRMLKLPLFLIKVLEIKFRRCMNVKKK